MELRPRAHVLPGEEEAQEVGGAHRLDLAPEPVERAAVDAREQAPVAPLDVVVRGDGAGREAAAQDVAVALDAAERRVRRRTRGRPSGAASAAAVVGPDEAEARADDLDERAFAIRPRRAPGAPAARRRRAEAAARARPAAASERRSAATQRTRRACAEARGAAGGDQRVEPVASTRAAVGLGQRAQVEQQIVQLVGIARVGLRLGDDGGDGLGVEPADVARRSRRAGRGGA